MTAGSPNEGPRAGRIVPFALVCLLAVLWIVGTAPSGGPDEPVHIVRSAALVRGQLEGERFPGQGRTFEIPAWVGHPDHGCFSLVGEQPANCATATTPPPGEAALVTTAVVYPIWGHLVPGLATYFPSSIGNQLARVFDAAIPLALLAAALSLASRRGAIAVASVALAVTPMAWFSIIVVNPSGLVIAGGLAVWVALLSAPGGSVPLDRLTAWTLAAGWAAMVLPRRDGMLWATVILAVAILAGQVNVVRLVRRLGTGPTVLVAASTLATMAWAARSSTVSSKLLLVAPLVVVAVHLFAVTWRRATSHASRAALAGGAVVVSCVAVTVALRRRPGGFDAELLRRIVDQTGGNLAEAIGLLGWLDAPVPRTALFAWLVALGVLAGLALLAQTRAVVVAASVVTIAIVGAWVLEMNQGTTSATYWQGRYYLPFLIGVPVLLGFAADRRPGDAPAVRRLVGVIAGIALFVLTMAFAASMRRWGVGTAGSMLPWDWDTYGTRLPPWVLLLLHAGIGVELARRAVAEVGRASSEVPAAPVSTLAEP